MAFKRRARKTYKKRKRIRKPRGRRVMRRTRGMTWNPQFFKVKRKIDFLVPTADLNRGTYGAYPFIQAWAGGATNYAFSSNAYYFAVSDVYNVSEFGLMWDQYKLSGVKVTFKYITATQSDINVANITGTTPQNYTVDLALTTDIDDDNALSATVGGWSALLETGRYKMKTFPNVKSNSMSIYVKPKVLTGTVNDAGTPALDGGRTTASPWMDGATSLDAKWYGIKAIARVNPSANLFMYHTFSATAVYYLKWKNRQ